MVGNDDPQDAKPREVPVDWEILEDAFENNAPEVHSYLHLETGEVLRVVNGVASPDVHARIAGDEANMRIDPVSSREQYRWMERFIPTVDDTELRERLMNAIDGKGAFRRFKDILMMYAPQRERWFAFRSQRLRVFMEAWLNAHSLRAVPRVVASPGHAERPGGTPVPEQERSIAQQRARSTETLRRQLTDIMETLVARDLDKVLTFAEFVRARRAARNYAQHPQSPSARSQLAEESAPGAPLDASGVGGALVHSEPDEEVPSSREISSTTR